MRFSRNTIAALFWGMILLLGACGRQSLAQAAREPRIPSGKAVIEQGIEAIGGHAALSRIYNRVAKGTLDLEPSGKTGTFVIQQARPNKLYVRMVIEGIGTIERGTDGRVFWERNSVTGLRVLQGQEKQVNLLAACFDETYYARVFKKIECTGIVPVEGQPCYKVLMENQDGDAVVVYYHQKSKFPVRQELTVHGQFGPTGIETTLMGYEEVSGVLFPHQTVEKSLGNQTNRLTESLEVNAKIPRATFELPEDVKKILAENP